MIIQENFPLSQILWYRTGPKARYVLVCTKPSDIRAALDFAEKKKITKIITAGLGSNIIFSGDYYDGVVILITDSNKSKQYIQRKDRQIEVFAGISLDNLIQFSFANKLIGLEWAGGLPGTVGSAVRGGVGAFGKEIKESVESVEVLEKNKERCVTRTLKKDELDFSYRNSLIKKNKNMIIMSAVFTLRPANSQSLTDAKNTYLSNIKYRQEHHPLEFPSCGSVFKNITEPERVEKILSVWPEIKNTVTVKWHNKISMGYVIDKLGFTGYRSGNMQVSPKHANFIVNLGGGKSADTILIIKEIQKKFEETFGFIPEVEVEIVS